MEFCSDRLIFRQFRPEDFSLYASVFSDEQIMKYAYMDQIVDEKEMNSSFKKVLENNVETIKKSSYEFAVFLSSDGSFIGYAVILLHYHLARVKDGEIGYFILPSYWGNGYATEIAKTLTDVCFNELKLHKVVASCNANNHKSERIMKKIGMLKEGEFRKERYKNGSWHNELRYGILVEEWNEQKSQA